MDRLQIGYICEPLQWVGWTDARIALDPARSVGGLDWPAIERALQADTMQLVVIRKEGDPVDLLACAVIRSAVTREGEALEIVAAAGHDYKLWAAWGMAALRKAARNAGMSRLQLAGRQGWRRIFPDMAMDGDMLTVNV